jgi:NADH-quinone oxidoreductase subunit N
MYLLENKNSEIYLDFSFLSLILLLLFGILVFVSTNNLFVIYLGIELQSLALYILCGSNRYSIKSVEASLKYYIYGSFSSLVLLLGISFIYLSLGTLNLYEINLLINSDFIYNKDVDIWLLNAGFIFILAGFFFKLAIAPFH